MTTTERKQQMDMLQDVSDLRPEAEAQTQDTGQTRAQTPAIEFIRCTERRKELEKELDEVKARLAALEPQVIDQFLELGVSSINTREGKRVELWRETQASLNNDEQGTKLTAYSTMREHGLGYMVKAYVMPQTLKSWVSEQFNNEVPIDPELEEVINIHRRDRVRVKNR